MGEFKTEATLVKRYQTVVTDTRGHGMVCDLPPEKGGYDQGTSAVELMVMALADCIITIYAVKAMGEKIDLKHLSIKMKANMPDGAPTIESFSATVTVKSPASEEACQKLLDETLKACPVGVLCSKACTMDIQLRYKE
ncbi:MAG: OsmC family protein [Candidatus Lokiarchaeota archaeon]|nr:OsmC family protein [Candidatus Lokiarchaeota archaeon]